MGFNEWIRFFYIPLFRLFWFFHFSYAIPESGQRVKYDGDKCHNEAFQTFDLMCTLFCCCCFYIRHFFASLWKISLWMTHFYIPVKQCDIKSLRGGKIQWSIDWTQIITYKYGDNFTTSMYSIRCFCMENMFAESTMCFCLEFHINTHQCIQTKTAYELLQLFTTFNNGKSSSNLWALFNTDTTSLFFSARIYRKWW